MRAELIAYGEVVENSHYLARNEEYRDSVIFPKKFADAIDGLNAGDTLEIFVNSPGGDVFEASAIAAMIERARSKGITVNSYIDGCAASSASFLVMASDNIYCYQSSIMMIHKPSALAYGNALSIRKTADALDKIEDSSMIPLYKSKAKKDIEDIKKMIEDSTWLSADNMAETFDIEIIEGTAKGTDDKNAKNIYSSFEKYAHDWEKVPNSVRNLIESYKPRKSQVKNPDYQKYRDAIRKTYL